MTSAYVERFWGFVPRRYMQNLFRYMFDAYNESYREAFAGYPPEEARSVFWMLRRAKIESQMRELAVPFSGSVVATAEPSSGNWYHSKLSFGNGVVITQNSAPHPDYILRPSLFRGQYAIKNDYLLFESPEERAARWAAARNRSLYGLLLHGRCGGYGLGFAVVRFPMPDLKAYSSSYIDLFKEFPEIANAKRNGDMRREGNDDFPDIEFNDGEGIG